MQTFLTDHDLRVNASNLDRQRLGKQRVEARQIAEVLCGWSSGWKRHPAVRMWKGYVGFLLRCYLPPILEEWEGRGYSNEKTSKAIRNLNAFTAFENEIRPPWITDQLILSHRSNLIQKFPEHYQPIWPDVKPGLPYVWPA